MLTGLSDDCSAQSLSAQLLRLEWMKHPKINCHEVSDLCSSTEYATLRYYRPIAAVEFSGVSALKPVRRSAAYSNAVLAGRLFLRQCQRTAISQIVDSTVH